MRLFLNNLEINNLCRDSRSKKCREYNIIPNKLNSFLNLTLDLSVVREIVLERYKHKLDIKSCIILSTAIEYILYELFILLSEKNNSEIYVSDIVQVIEENIKFKNLWEKKIKIPDKLFFHINSIVTQVSCLSLNLITEFYLNGLILNFLDKIFTKTDRISCKKILYYFKKNTHDIFGLYLLTKILENLQNYKTFIIKHHK